ncbi:DUF1993 domain-containing protein [Aquirhabdus parva]|uniref:DUF1993 domain-containing protein n=1 Tax=Aquirhabdus parva TaxID=2283318 RepID=A0A345P5B8_9GAMM|nr:DUF1993 domain-containing protein [Aquirhabdus parva]AXI02477.1 DUF1993 domain-containing protein [Aquirhabdus parva]
MTTLYTASVPVFKQLLTALKNVLTIAETYATDKKIDPKVLLQSRLYPDMFPLVRQVQIAADFAKSVPSRLASIEVPAYEDIEQTFAELQTRIDNTLRILDGITANQIDGKESLEIVLRPGTPKEKKLNGETYLLNYGLPQFFFHVTTTYAILRNNGVEIGKRDFMGAY